MNITKETIDALNGIIKLSIEKADYEEAVSKTLKDYGKKVNMPGFRAGKVPAGLVKKMYGKAILADEVNKLMSQKLFKYIHDEKLNILGEPLPNENEQKKIDWDKDENFEFVFDIAFAPEFSIALDKRSKIPFYEIEVDDAMINEQVESYTTRFGENKAAEVVEEKETVRGEFVQLDADGNILEDGIKASDALIAVDTIKNEDVKDQFIGKKISDVLTFSPKAAFENDGEVAHLLNIDKEAAGKLEGNFSYTITTINKFIPAEINENFFKKVFGEETEVKTEEEFRSKIAAEIKDSYAMSSEYKFGIDAKENLIKKANFELPVEFLKRWILTTNNKMTAEQIDSEWSNFEVDLKWQLIKEKLIKENNLEVSEEEVRQAAKEMAIMQFRQYGMNNIPDEHLENYANSILEKEEDKQRFYTKKLEDKIFEVVKEKVNVETKEINRDEFNKLFN